MKLKHNPLCLAGLAVGVLGSTCSPEYDYVVVGSGPGGGTLAANLAREGYSVFLIEAGGNTGDSLLQSVPSWGNMNVETPGMGWGFFVSHYLNQTQEQRDRYYNYRMPNGSIYTGLEPPQGAEPLGIYYPRGSTIGGSMVANAMNFMMPPNSNWEYIAELTGDDTWNPQQMREYFIELERNVYLEPGNPQHGYDGYITSNRNNITYVTSRPGTMRVVRNAISELYGIHNATEEEVVRLMERDLNSADPDRFTHEGVFQTIVNIDENRRRSSPFNYIADTLAAMDEDGSPLYNLTLSTHSLATKVLFDSTDGARPRAIGVEYQVGTSLYEADHAYDPSAPAETRIVSAEKEVIVAGGAFNTPQILKLSGVGPRAELEEHGIEVLVDLPAVGEYLRDNYEAGIHVNAAIPWENNPMAGCLFNPNATVDEDPCLAQWFDGYGPYGQGSAPVFMLLRTSHAETDDADLIVFGGASTVFDGHFPGFSRSRWPQESFFFAIVDEQSAQQAGYVRLKSSNPRHQPEIHLDFYPEGSEADIAALSEGVERLLGILNRTGEPYQPFEVVQPPPGESIEQSIRDHSWTHHVTSSCRMGPADDPDYCVDSKFRVNGVDGLRVVDGSVFPISPGGFPASSTATVSRKAFYDIIAAAQGES